MDKDRRLSGSSGPLPMSHWYFTIFIDILYLQEENSGLHSGAVTDWPPGQEGARPETQEVGALPMSARTLRRRTSVAGATLLIAGGAAGAMAASASASTTQLQYQPPWEAYGSVELGSPLQYEQFLALQGFGRYRGDVDYTNWTYAEPG